MKKLTLVFENCEAFDINCKSISYDVIDEQTNTIDNIKIIISDSEDGLYNCYGSKNIKFNRIMQYDDICTIFIDGIKYNVKWYYENEYDCPQNNENQKSYIDDNGNLIIDISSSIGYNKNRIKNIINSLNVYMNEHTDIDWNFHKHNKIY